ncbi:transport protein Sec61 subunit alpha-like protein [Tanacetum coccineum]
MLVALINLSVTSGLLGDRGSLTLTYPGQSATLEKCLADMAANPFHALFYLVFMLTTCALFSKTWIEVSGSSTRDVAKQLKHEHVGTTNGDAWPSRLKPAEGTEPIHPNSGCIWRMCIVALTVLADFMGAIGSGTRILLIIFTCEDRILKLK